MFAWSVVILSVAMMLLVILDYCFYEGKIFYTETRKDLAQATVFFAIPVVNIALLIMICYKMMEDKKNPL